MVSMAEEVCAPILGNPQGVVAGFGILGDNWVVLTFLALFCSLLSLAVLYMVANFLRNQTLLAWIKFELFQILGTATVFAFAILWASGMCTFDMGFLNDQYLHRNMYDIVDEYFSFLRGVGNVLFGYMMYMSKIITLLQKVTYFSSPLGLGMTDNPLDSMGQLNSILFFAVGGYITSYMMLDLQFKIMEYMAFATMHYLFPFGVFFRAFEPTRGFGGALIGLSLSFFLFYPMLVVFNHYIIYNSLEESRTDLEAEMGNANAHVVNGEVPDEQALKNSIDDLANVMNVQKMTEGMGSATVFLFKPLALYLIAAVALPVINFVVLVELTKGLTSFLGDEVDITNLTRMI
ncbi:MAG: hypothetical protein WCT52_00125 [Candidatus Micrarchaeia archaeon]